MEEEEECGLMPNVMAALRNIGGANDKRNFRPLSHAAKFGSSAVQQRCQYRRTQDLDAK